MKLLNGDCLNLLNQVEDNSIDLVLTDPPYNISRKNNFKTMGRNGIDFGNWDKNADLLSWINLVRSKVNKNGSIIIFNDWRNLGEISCKLGGSGFITKDLIRWVKNNPMPRNRDRRYITDYEMAIWAVKKGSKWTFNRQSDKYDRPLIECPITPKSEKYLGSHPTQKPIKLMEDLLLRHSNENGIILDPFMGSGSTGVACVNTNRDFIGIELDKKYFEIAQDRIHCAEENK